jgi:hypothetical protein
VQQHVQQLLALLLLLKQTLLLGKLAGQLLQLQWA